MGLVKKLIIGGLLLYSIKQCNLTSTIQKYINQHEPQHIGMYSPLEQTVQEEEWPYG